MGIFARLLRLYPKPFRERFAESMEQTFFDLYQERMNAESGTFRFAIWIFLETSLGIIRENLVFMIRQDPSRRLLVWTVVVALLLLTPLVAMQFTEQVNWTLPDFLVMGGLLFGVILAYEFVLRRQAVAVYRVALGLALATVFLLTWVNGAVGIIGNESNAANSLYFGVILVGVVGCLIARLRAKGMALALLCTALAQLSVPFIAMIAWWSQATSWDAGAALKSFLLNSLFVMLFIGSAVMFRRAALETN